MVAHTDDERRFFNMGARGACDGDHDTSLRVHGHLRCSGIHSKLLFAPVHGIGVLIDNRRGIDVVFIFGKALDARVLRRQQRNHKRAGQRVAEFCGYKQTVLCVEVVLIAADKRGHAVHPPFV